MATIQKIGIPGKQVYSLDTVTGEARIEVTGISGGSVSSGASSTAAAPTLVEGATSALSEDLSGNLRVTLGTLLSGEDTTNNLLKVSGGVVRQTIFSSVTSATSSAVTTVPVGPKTFMGQITNGTSETKALTVDIYGNWTNSTTGGVRIGTITLPSTVTVTHLEDALPVVTANFSYYYYTVTAYTSASSAPFTLYAMY